MILRLFGNEEESSDYDIMAGSFSQCSLIESVVLDGYCGPLFGKGHQSFKDSHWENVISV
jgi:hypothetical protein